MCATSGPFLFEINTVHYRISHGPPTKGADQIKIPTHLKRDGSRILGVSKKVSTKIQLWFHLPRTCPQPLQQLRKAAIHRASMKTDSIFGCNIPRWPFQSALVFFGLIFLMALSLIAKWPIDTQFLQASASLSILIEGICSHICRFEAVRLLFRSVATLHYPL